MKFLCEQCKAKYQIADEKAAGKTVRMKCRKCGHLIEVRAGVVEGGAASDGSQPPGPAAPRAPGAAPTAPRAPSQKPAPPRAAPLAAARPATKPPEKPTGALAGALKSALQRDDEVSAPVDMSDLSPSDEWYVAINGVPVGPIRIAEVRRKAAIGAVTEESLCWQEGLDEWRPLRSFPELAAIVREAFTSGRSSLTPPPPEGRSSALPPQRQSLRPANPSTGTGIPPRAPPARPTPIATPAPPVARSNVVPITSRLATAEKLAEEPDDLTRPFTGTLPSHEPSVVPDPFAAPPRPAAAAAASAFVPPAAADPFAAQRQPSLSGIPVAPAKKGPPWMAIAMIAAAAAFGVTAAIAVFLRPAPAPAPVVVQVPGAPATAAATAATTSPTPTSTESSEPVASAGGPSAPRPVAMAKATATAANTGGSSGPAPKGPLDLHSIAQGSNVAPTDEPGGGGGEAPRAPGQCISGGQVQTVIGLHRVALQRTCWERSASQKPSANVTVSLTIGADGSAQGVSASGDDASVAKCIENDVRGWRFPAMGCSQPTSIPFHFVRQ